MISLGPSSLEPNACGEIERNPAARNWGYIYSYSGRRVGPAEDQESPSIQDIAVSLGRICRYAGGCVRFFPVLLHSFVVADLVEQDAKIYALLHDATESIVGDIPRGFKTDEIADVEDLMFEKILRAQQLPLPTAEQWMSVKYADNQALFGEVWTVGNAGLRTYYMERNRMAEELALEYVRRFPPEECIQPDGLAVLEFVRRYRDYTVGGQL
jgi:hypothetical protein